MRIFGRVIKISSLVIFLLFIIAFFAVYHINKQSIPDYNATLQIKGLKRPVKVFRDSFAIPHFYAENEDDLYRATGYLIAQERLWQMDVLRRLG